MVRLSAWSTGSWCGRVSREPKVTHCTIEGCTTATLRGRRVCDKHRSRLKKYGDPNHVRAKAPTTECMAKDCTNVATNGVRKSEPMCPKHYERRRRTGVFEDADWEKRLIERKETNPTRASGGYVGVYYGGVWMMEHRAVMSDFLGRPLTARDNVHHRNGIRNDNRIENLELWTSSQPSGQRVSDLLEWADEIQDKYEGEMVRVDVYDDGTLEVFEL